MKKTDKRPHWDQRPSINKWNMILAFHSWLSKNGYVDVTLKPKPVDAKVHGQTGAQRIHKGTAIAFRYLANGPLATVVKGENGPYWMVSSLAEDAFRKFQGKLETKTKARRELAKRDRMSADAYVEYLTSDEWRKRSTACVERAGKECEVCGGEKELQAHHYNYRHLFSEPIEDLFCLCCECHRLYHSIYPASKLPMDRFPRNERLVHIQGTVLSAQRNRRKTP